MRHIWVCVQDWLNLTDGQLNTIRSNLFEFPNLIVFAIYEAKRQLMELGFPKQSQNIYYQSASVVKMVFPLEV